MKKQAKFHKNIDSLQMKLKAKQVTNWYVIMVILITTAEYFISLTETEKK